MCRSRVSLFEISKKMGKLVLDTLTRRRMILSIVLAMADSNIYWMKLVRSELLSVIGDHRQIGHSEC